MPNLDEDQHATRSEQDSSIRSTQEQTMHVEILGPYRLELSAMQHIENGGWAAYAAVHCAEEEGNTQLNLPHRRVVDDDTVFASAAAALSAARRVVIDLIGAFDDAKGFAA